MLDTKTVYKLAKTLEVNDQIELYKMLRNDIDLIVKKSIKQTLPNFSLTDGIIYLIENHFNKIKKL